MPFRGQPVILIAVPSTRRIGFVVHQVELARSALVAGRVGGACAALRVLLPEDFDRLEEATAALGAIRDTSASEDARASAAMRIIEFGLAAADDRSTGKHLALDRSFDQEDTNPG